MSRICLNRSGPGKSGVQFFVHVKTLRNMDKKLEIAHIQVFVHAKTLQNMDKKLDYSKYMFLSDFLPRKHEQKHGHRFEPVRQQSVNL